MTPWVRYTDYVQKKDYDAVALDVYHGKYGNEPIRSQKLKAEGYTATEIKIIQSKVDVLVNGTKEEYYVVKKGDTLDGIASKYKTTRAQLLKLNPNITNPHLIRIGMKVRVK